MATAFHQITHFDDEHLRVHNARFWTLALITSTGWAITIILLGFYLRQPRERPYVVMVSAKGEPLGMVQPFGATPFAQQDVIVKWAIHEWIRNARTVTPDIAQQKDHLWYAYAFVMGQAYDELDLYYKDPRYDRNPFDIAQKYWVEVSNIQILKLPSPETYQAQWDEKRTEYNTAVPIYTHWRATMKVIGDEEAARTVRPPAPDPDRNPLGLYIQTLDWAEDSQEE